MFGRRTVSVPARYAALPAERRRPDMRLLSAGAVALLAVSAAGAVFALGDPHAGGPSARARIAAPEGHEEPAGWRRALAAGEPVGAAPVTLETLQLFDASMPIDPVAIVDEGPIAPGQAIITLASTGGAPGAAGPLVGAPVFNAEPLAPAPIAGLTAQGSSGPLPIVGPGGRTPFSAYARPFQATGRPKVAIVIGGLGLNADYTRAAIERLPPEVTLSFIPYADGLQQWIDQARARGHEVLLELPLEPNDYPANDPGPYTLLTNAQPAETTRRLEWLLSRATGYFGVTNYLGSRFLQSDASTGALAEALRARGLGFYDDGTGRGRGAVPGLRRASAAAIIDDQQSAETIDRALLQLEATALQSGQALGSGFAYPVTLDQVARWAAGLESRGYQLAPASAIAGG